jgi:hypothetical protein
VVLRLLDLGLKVAFCDPEESDKVLFREVVGWTTCTRSVDGVVTNGFLPVVIDDDFIPRIVPRMALLMKHFAGTFPKDMWPSVVCELIQQKRSRSQADQFVVNVPGRGEA